MSVNELRRTEIWYIGAMYLAVLSVVTILEDDQIYLIFWIDFFPSHSSFLIYFGG